MCIMGKQANFVICIMYQKEKRKILAQSLQWEFANLGAIIVPAVHLSMFVHCKICLIEKINPCMLLKLLFWELLELCCKHFGPIISLGKMWARSGFNLFVSLIIKKNQIRQQKYYEKKIPTCKELTIVSMPITTMQLPA